MNDFFSIVNKYYKLILKIALGVLGGIVTIAAGYALSTVRTAAAYLGGGGWYTFLLVIYWIAVVAVILCGIYKVAEMLVKKGAVSNNGGYNQNVNNFAQPNFNNQVNNGFNAQPQAPQGEKFCPVCGSKIPVGNQFCPNCGNKI